MRGMAEQLTAVDVVRAAIPADDELQRMAFEEYLESRAGGGAGESGLAPAGAPSPDIFFFMLQAARECLSFVVSNGPALLSTAATSMAVIETVRKWCRPARLPEAEAEEIARRVLVALEGMLRQKYGDGPPTAVDKGQS